MWSLPQKINGVCVCVGGEVATWCSGVAKNSGAPAGASGVRGGPPDDPGTRRAWFGAPTGVCCAVPTVSVLSRLTSSDGISD